MKNIIKRIINLIILIVVAIGVFIITKNIPNFLIANEDTINNTAIQTIEKVEETEKAMAPGALFEVTTSNLHQYSFGDGYYWRVDAPNVSPQIYCAEKGAKLSGRGYSYEEVVNHANSARGRYGHAICVNPRKYRI